MWSMVRPRLLGSEAMSGSQGRRHRNQCLGFFQRSASKPGVYGRLPARRLAIYRISQLQRIHEKLGRQHNRMLAFGFGSTGSIAPLLPTSHD